MRKLPPPSSHVIQLTGTIFELNSRIKETNVLSKFYENWAKNVTSAKNAPPIGGYVFSSIPTIFKLVRVINNTNVLTNFHDDWAKIVTSRVFTRYELTGTRTGWLAKTLKNAPPTGGHVFSTISSIFELVRDINRTNVLTNFHDDWAKRVTSRVFTRKTAPPTGGHVLQRIGTTCELNQDIIKTNILTNFELGRDIIGTKLLTKFHRDVTRNVSSRVFTSKCLRTDGRTYDGQRPVTKAHLSNQLSLKLMEKNMVNNIAEGKFAIVFAHPEALLNTVSEKDLLQKTMIDPVNGNGRKVK
ncbi:hypothetical protein DPMN_042539 [Dreissena polymorpha]|uniref:Uncharacterized protein n=1 Tax=Dreissena polymorpha TaxID=45954 RepID=A0A9D4D279_DREPO|nr:hypothetical protein DPMN_042539 [Dreissena polymorpha]